MKLNYDITQLRIDGRRPLHLAELPTNIDKLYDGKWDYVERIEEYRDEINDLQELMYAHDRYSMLLVFQAMDAAGKDSTIQHVMSGINPHGVEVHAFKQPSAEELDHDFLWRTTCRMPPRGRIGIFNRSYYEEVLIARVEPRIVTESQKLPAETLKDMDKLWMRRYHDIRHLEEYYHHNGTRTVKFYLHLSKDEQRHRFLRRLETPSKQWKFSEADLETRARWDDYMRCYETCINNTATAQCPWYVIPADNKKNMRLLVSQIILHHLRELDMQYPPLTDAVAENLKKYRQMLEAEKE